MSAESAVHTNMSARERGHCIALHTRMPAGHCADLRIVYIIKMVPCLACSCLRICAVKRTPAPGRVPCKRTPEDHLRVSDMHRTRQHQGMRRAHSGISQQVSVVSAGG